MRAGAICPNCLAWLQYDEGEHEIEHSDDYRVTVESWPIVAKCVCGFFRWMRVRWRHRTGWTHA
jgi:hypothetical protein